MLDNINRASSPPPSGPNHAPVPTETVSDAQMLDRINLPARLDRLAAQGTSQDDMKMISDAMDLWISCNNGLADLKAQALAVKNQEVQKVNVPIGSILVRKDECPETASQARTLQLQLAPGLNGIADNRGDANASHILLWTSGWTNAARQKPGGAGVPEQVEARGGTVMQVQARAVQEGKYWVYAPEDKNVGDWAAQAGLMWEKTPYSRSILGTAVKPTGQFTELTESAKKDIVAVAKDPFTHQPAHTQPAGEDHFRSMTGRPRTPGDCCSSFAVRLFQVAQAQVDLARQNETSGKKHAGPELMTDDEIETALKQSTDRYTGLLANNAEGMSPRSVEHFCKTAKGQDGKPQFEFMGVLHIAPKDVLYTEADMAKHAAAQA